MPNSEIIVPIDSIWHEHSDGTVQRASDVASVDIGLTEHIRKHGQMMPVRIKPASRIGPRQYFIIDGFRRLASLVQLGKTDVLCHVIGVISQDRWRNLRETETPLGWGYTATEMLDRDGVHIEELIAESHLPRSVVLDRIKAAREVRAELRTAEEHGKVLAYSQMRQDKNEEQIRQCLAKVTRYLCRTNLDGERFEVPVPVGCNGARCRLNDSGHVVHDERCALTKKKSPKERGMVLCLQPGCKVWIKKDKVGKGLMAGMVDHFCKSHHRFRQWEDFPLHDRQGCAIWVDRQYNVLRISDMGEGHLTNAIAMLDRAAEKRAQITGIDKAKALEAFPRYPLLVAEAKQRDACKACRDGVVVQVVDTDLVGPSKIEEQVKFCTCERGQVRSAAAHLAAKQQDSKDRGAAFVAIAMAFCTALLIGRSSEHVARFCQMVLVQLRAMGVL